MWPMSKKSSTSSRASSDGTENKGAVTEQSKVVKLLLRKRYGKLGPAGDYAPSKSFSFRFKSSRKSKLGSDDTTGVNRANDPEGPRIRRSASTSSIHRRTVMEKLGDAYVDMIWSAASHAARPIGAKPKVPLSRAMTFEKMFGEPHDTMLRFRSLNSLDGSMMMIDLTDEAKH